jgi:hypothetical protein
MQSEKLAIQGPVAHSKELPLLPSISLCGHVSSEAGMVAAAQPTNAQKEGRARLAPGPARSFPVEDIEEA